MRLRRWHRLGIILTVIGGIGVFYGVFTFTRDDELGADIVYRQRNECRVAERRGVRADVCYREVERRHEMIMREKWEKAALVTAGAVAAAWVAAFISIGLYRWVMAGAPTPGSGGNRADNASRTDGGNRSRGERIEPKI